MGEFVIPPLERSASYHVLVLTGEVSFANVILFLKNDASLCSH